LLRKRSKTALRKRSTSSDLPANRLIPFGAGQGSAPALLRNRSRRAHWRHVSRDKIAGQVVASRMKTQLECGVSGSMAAVLGRSVQLHLVGSARGLSNTVCFRSHARQCLSLQAENCLGRLGHVPMNRTFRFSMLRIIRFRAQTVLPRCATRRSTEVRDSVGLSRRKEHPLVGIQVKPSIPNSREMGPAGSSVTVLRANPRAKKLT